MEISDKIIGYLKQTYRPDAIVIYGSFSDGSANENSDFDALVIAGDIKTHDSSVIDGIILDVFVYPTETFQAAFDPEEFVQIWDGKIVLDKDGTAERLQKRVLDHIERKAPKPTEEILREIGWCEKMALRTMREDAEGRLRIMEVNGIPGLKPVKSWSPQIYALYHPVADPYRALIGTIVDCAMERAYGKR